MLLDPDFVSLNPGYIACSPVMPALVAGIHVLRSGPSQRRQARP
jgi:hypothetical protein